MLISSKGRYALRLMIYIAALGDTEGKIALREVADREHISQKYLEQLVRPLMKAGLLKSVRGKGGGYMMAKDPAEVRAGDIVGIVGHDRRAAGRQQDVCDVVDGDVVCDVVHERRFRAHVFQHGLEHLLHRNDSFLLRKCLHEKNSGARKECCCCGPAV